MQNHTLNFIKLLEEVLKENKEYFNILENIKTKQGLPNLKKKILDDYKVSVIPSHIYKLEELFENEVKNYILINKDNFTMNTSILYNISKQIQIDYLLKNTTKQKANLYYSIVESLRYHGIYRDEKIVPLSNSVFWKELIKRLYLLKLISHSGFDTSFEIMYEIDKSIPSLTEAKNNIENSLKEKINIIDGKVIFDTKQEEKIVKKIEKKLLQINLFSSLEYILKNHKTNESIPITYIINLLIKNINNSKHKVFTEEKIEKIIRIIDSFIELYELKSRNQFEYTNINEYDINKKLKKQIMHSNFYSLNKLKTNTIIEYLINIIKPSINNDEFYKEFHFSIDDLISFLNLLERQKNHIIMFSNIIFTREENEILKTFSIGANLINKNYSTLGNLYLTDNIFTFNPIVKYKEQYYIIGFQYFKFNFYTALVEKIKATIDEKINEKIGPNIDIFVENIFSKIKSKHTYEIFSGHYRPPKKENPESDLTLKTKDKIIFLENKNKYLTKDSFSGSESNILKDLVLSFAFSQIQLLRHERNLIKYKQLNFKNGKVLKYEEQDIIKISISTNNWYSIMNNIPRNLILALIRLRFKIDENKKYEDVDSFYKVNKYLDNLLKIIEELDRDSKYNLKTILHQTLFLPLELLVENYQDENFINEVIRLLSIKMNTDNILNIYSYSKKLNMYNKNP